MENLQFKSKIDKFLARELKLFNQCFVDET